MDEVMTPKHRAPFSGDASIGSGFQLILHGMVLEIAELSARGVFSTHLAKVFATRLDDLHFTRMMTRQEGARFLGVSLRTLDRWVREQGLPSAWRVITPGKKPQRIFFAEDLLQWQVRHLTNLRPQRKGD